MTDTVTRSRIVKDLRALGIERGDMLVVHSSLKSIGYVEGGAPTVVQALKDAVGPSGTIVMPVFTKPADVFIARDARSTTGLVTETFRTWDGTLRSLHPTHSVAAWGREAHGIVREHQHCQALGVNSPLHRLAKRGGKVLAIGVGYNRVSIIHVAESVARAPYQDIFYPGYQRATIVVAANGRRFKYTPKDNPGDSSAFGIIEERLAASGKLTEGRVGKARATLALGSDVVGAALDVLREDGSGLLCKDASCAVCPKRRAKVERLRWRYLGNAHA